MIKSAAIVKTKTLAPWKELRLQKRKLKKAQAFERKATKVYYPSPMGKVQEIIEVIEMAPATREEMLQQAELMGLKVDKRWSDATLLKHIEEPTWVTQSDNS